MILKDNITSIKMWKLKRTLIKPMILLILIWGGVVLIIKTVSTWMSPQQLIMKEHEMRNDDMERTKEESAVRRLIMKQQEMMNDETERRLKEESESGKGTNKTKIIYMDNPVHWLVDWVGKSWESSDIFKSCPVSNCLLSRDKGLLSKSDVIIFRSIFVPKTCMKRRKTGQIWVFMEHESPLNFDRAHRGFPDCYRNKFNWTYTYRRDSDFTLAHGYFTENKAKTRDSSLERDIKSKTRNAVGFISNCPVTAQRVAFVKKLNANGLNADVVGQCGNLQCSNANRHKTSWNTTGVKNTCFDVLNTKYKFFLSFENSICADYVTEKSLNLIMSRNIVPVIRDGVNHSLYHPPGSYIHTSDFANVHDLSSYLLNVANNETKYREFFSWRKHYSIHGIIDILQENICEICKRSNNPEKYRRLYSDVGKFVWSYAGKSVCSNPNDI